MNPIFPSTPIAASPAAFPPAREIHMHEPGSEPPQNQTHPHVHSEESLRKIVNRLSRLEGHIRGIKTMVQESRPCPDVLIQVAAVRGGLDRVARIILDEHLSECVTRAVDEGNIAAEVDALKAALDRFIS
ncbi:MAG: metal-sensitive transcriptional regulator [Phormidesmis sp.]